MPSDSGLTLRIGIAPKRWQRRLERLAIDVSRLASAAVTPTALMALSPAERQDLAGLQAREQRVGLGGLPVADMERYLDGLVRLEDEPCGD